MQELEQNFNPDKLEDNKLLLAHATLHFFYKDEVLGRGVEDWTEEEIVEKHSEVVSEMENRGMKHQYMNELDDEGAEAVKMKISQMEENDATQWAKDFLNSEQKAEFIQENNPDMEWISDAIEFVEQQNSEIEMSDYIAFSPIQELDEEQEEYVEIATEQEDPDVYGIYKNEDDKSKVLLVESDDKYRVYSDSKEVYQSDSIKESIKRYNSVKKSHETIEQQTNWVVPSDPDEFDMADPETDWNGDEITVTNYRNEFGYDDDVQWQDFDEEDKITATQHHAASSTGVPAENFGDLSFPHHQVDGTVVLRGVNAAKAANSGARAEPNRPLDIKSRIDSHLESHQDEFAEEFESVEQGSVVSGDEADRGRWYVWDIDDAIEWADAHGFETNTREIEGNFVSLVQIPDENVSDDIEITSVWRGETFEPRVFIPGVDDFPVMFTVIEQEDTVSTQVKAVKFQIRQPEELPVETQDVAQEAIESDVSYHWYVWEEEEAEEFVENEFEEDFEVVDEGIFTKFSFKDETEDIESGWTGSAEQMEEPTPDDKPKLVLFDGSEVVGVKFQTEEPEDKEALLQ